MSQNPLNLGLRFILELVALYAFGFWGWVQHEGAMRYVLMVGLPLLAAILWGTFRIPEDASANGKAPVPVSGWVRLLLEVIFFSFATFCFLDAGSVTAGYAFGSISFLHYILSYDRIVWMLKR